MTFKRHLLIAGALLVAAFAFIAARNWGTIATMVDNAATLNEGSQAAAAIRSPGDLLDYFAAHPEQVSLVAFDLGAGDAGLRHRADTLRALVTAPRLQLLAAYAQRTHAGTLDPDRPVGLDSVGVFALPGVTAKAHERAVASLHAEGEAPPRAVPLWRLVRMVARHNDGAAADWLWAHLGAEALQDLPGTLGLAASGPPQPATGRTLAWRRNREGASWTQMASLTRRLQTDAAFRHAQAEQLAAQGAQLRLDAQRRLAQSTFPTGTAADYAALLARIADGSLAASPVADTLQRLLERPLAAPGDSAATPFTAVASMSGAFPGVLSFVGYAHRPDAPTRVVVLFADGLPLAVMLHLMQTGIDKGFELQLLSDDAFVERVRQRLAAAASPEIAP